MINYLFHRSLHARGLTQSKLAEASGVHRTILSRLFNNAHGRGKETRAKLFPFLTPDEIRLLGWEKEYDAWVSQSSTSNIVPPAPTV